MSALRDSDSEFSPRSQFWGKILRDLKIGEEQKTDIQALPLKPWELMSKSEVVIRGRGGEVDFPLSRHGQGMQSLSVLFLFQAYIDVLLKPTFQPETEAILALEEERRNCFVAITRTIKTLTLSYSERYRDWPKKPSRFLYEMGLLD